MLTLLAVKNALPPPCCKQSAAVETLEQATVGLASGSTYRPGGRDAGGHVVFQIGPADSDAAASDTEAEGPKPAGTNSVTDRAFAYPQHVRGFADRQQAWGWCGRHRAKRQTPLWTESCR